MRKVARIDWNNNDASIYITSYCPPGGRTFAGNFAIPPCSVSHTWDFTGQLEGGEEMPRMSLHESGQTKTNLAGRNTQFIDGQPLFNAAGGHIATIKTFKPETLPPVNNWASKGATNILAVSGQTQWTSVRFPVTVHVDERRARLHKFFVTFKRPLLQNPIYVGVDVVGEYEPHNDGDGVIVFGGWGPEIRPSAINDVAFTVTQSSP